LPRHRAGIPEPGREQLHNTDVLVDSRGEELLRYRKTHLFGDLY
jgi:predicted amidohydrolase